MEKKLGELTPSEEFIAMLRARSAWFGVVGVVRVVACTVSKGVHGVSGAFFGCFSHVRWAPWAKSVGVGWSRLGVEDVFLGLRPPT